MTSGPSVALVLTKGETGEGIIEEWRELLGPPSVEEAKESAPDRYGSLITLPVPPMFIIWRSRGNWQITV